MVKEFLESIRAQDKMLRAYEQDLKDLRQRAYSISSPKLGDKIQANHLGSLDEIVEKLLSQVDRVNREWDRLIAMRDKAKEMIGSIKRVDVRCVMYRRYICNQSWEQIAVDMHYSLRRVYQVHGAGLLFLERERERVQ